jgi:hypothetical protein
MVNMTSSVLKIWVLVCLLLFSHTGGCTPTPAEEPDIFTRNGLHFSGPYVTFHGDKDPEMALEFILYFSTMDDHCRGAYIRDANDVKGFVPGGGGTVKGRAYKHIYLPANPSPYSIKLPLHLTCDNGCKWKMEELWIRGRHPFIHFRGRDHPVDVYVASFGPPSIPFVEPDIPDILPNYCQKVEILLSGDTMHTLYCRYPGRTGQAMRVHEKYLEHGGEVKMDITVSDDIKDGFIYKEYEQRR